MRDGTLIKAVYNVINNLNDEELLSVANVTRILKDSEASVNTSLNTLEKRGLIIRSEKTTNRGGKLYKRADRKVIKVNMSSWLKK